MPEKERKVLIIVENLPVPFDTRVWQEATTLVQNGYVVSVICPKGKNFTTEYEKLEGVHVFRHDLPTEGNGLFGYLREYGSALRHQMRLAKIIHRDIGFDVIHGCNPPDTIFLIYMMFKRRGVDYIFDHHDICPELYYAKFKKGGPAYKAMLFLERQTFRHATISFATNHSYRQIALERGGMNEDKVFVLRSGPKLDRMKLQDPMPELRRGKRYMVGYVGVIGQQEGLDYLLEAARIIVKEKGREDVCFAICGGGPYLETIRKLTEEAGLQDWVEFLGRVSDADLMNYLNTSDICVNPDEYNEMNDKSTMNKVLEYMALGKALVQFDLTEGRFSAQDASLYAKRNDPQDMADKIMELIDNPSLREEMGKKGRNRVLSELNWEHTKKALLEGYEAYYRLRSSKEAGEKR